jgi:predicted nucleotidyltransferase component of viral defense system
VARHACFALKGGTAINLFLRPMPRLSVDIDLAYVPIGERQQSLSEIEEALQGIAAGIASRISGTRVAAVESEGTTTRLLVARENTQVKIEPNLVVRGTVFPPESRDLCDADQQEFELFASASCLSVPDLYAGKICAALDRQNPRDLYDVMLLLEDEGITPEIRRAFVV